MKAYLRRLLFYPPGYAKPIKPRLADLPDAVWFLLLGVAIMAFGLGLASCENHSSVLFRLSSAAIPAMLIINTLAFQFQWTERAGKGWRVAAILTSVAGCTLLVFAR